MTVLDIPITKGFSLEEELGKASFFRIDSSRYEGNNGYCFESENCSYEPGTSYFIQLDLEVTPIINKDTYSWWHLIFVWFALKGQKLTRRFIKRNPREKFSRG